MISNFKIDGVDGSSLGVCLQRNGCRDIFALPSLKYADITDWPDEDGLEIDYRSLTFSARTINLTFIYESRAASQAFLAVISDGGYHTFEFTDYDITLSLRLKGRGGYTRAVNAGSFTLSFIDDAAPETSDVELFEDGYLSEQGVAIDTIDFSNLGIIVVDGTIQSINNAAMPVTKEGLVIDVKSLSGQTYIAQSVAHRNFGDITLQLLIRAKSVGDLKQAHRNLLHFMCSSDTEDGYMGRVLRADDTRAGYAFLYKSSSVQFVDKLATGAFWLRLMLNLSLVGETKDAYRRIYVDGERLVYTRLAEAEVDADILTSEGKVINKTLKL